MVGSYPSQRQSARQGGAQGPHKDHGRFADGKRSPDPAGRVYTRPVRTSQTLALWLRLGALWDWLLAALILRADPALMAWLHFPPPGDLFLFRLSAMPLVFFGLVYWLTAGDPDARRWAVRASITIRLAGGIMLGLLTLVHRPPGAALYLGTAGVDLLWGTLWLAMLASSRVAERRPGQAG